MDVVLYFYCLFSPNPTGSVEAESGKPDNMKNEGKALDKQLSHNLIYSVVFECSLFSKPFAICRCQLELWLRQSHV